MTAANSREIIRIIQASAETAIAAGLAVLSILKSWSLVKK